MEAVVVIVKFLIIWFIANLILYRLILSGNWIKKQVKQYYSWLKRHQKSDKYNKMLGKFVLCLLCLGMCIILSLTTLLISAMTAVAAVSNTSSIGIGIVEDILDKTVYEKDPAVYEISQEEKTINEYETEKETGLFMNLKKKKPVVQITSDVMEFYYEQISGILSSLGEGINPNLQYEEAVVVDYNRLRELDEEIKKCTGKIEVPIEIYKEEYEIRKCAYSKEPSAKNAYQTGRASDDVFHILYLKCKQGYMLTDEEEKIDADKIYFYASQAILYYNESLKNLNDEETRNDTIFKMGMIFQKLYLLSDILQDDNQIHFLLVANSFFKLCKNYDIKDNTCEGQFNYYYGCNLYEVGFSAEMEIKNEIWEAAVFYFQTYISSKEIESSENTIVDLKEDSEYRIRIIEQNLN